MVADRLVRSLAFASVVAFYVVATPRGGQTADCESQNIIGTYTQDASNPVVTSNPGGGFSFNASSSVTWDCTTGSHSDCGMCAITRWYTSTAQTGTGTPYAVYSATASAADCGSTANKTTFTDKLSTTKTDGLWYAFLFGYGAPVNGNCPDPAAGGTYTKYGSGSFQNN